SLRLLFSLPIRPSPSSPLFPYTTLFRSLRVARLGPRVRAAQQSALDLLVSLGSCGGLLVQDERVPLVRHFDGEQRSTVERVAQRSEEHTSELQSRGHLVCRLLLEKKKQK